MQRNCLGKMPGISSSCSQGLLQRDGNLVKGRFRTLTRLARYLIAHRRLVTKFRFQEACSVIDDFSDSDSVRCGRMAKSTSGGCIMICSHDFES